MKMLYERPKLLIFLIVIGMSSGVFLPGCSDEDITEILPNVSLSAYSLDFGEVFIESSSYDTVTVNNLTDETISIERVTSTNSAFQVGGYYDGNELIPLNLSDPIKGNQSQTIYVVFYPAEETEYVGELVIETKTPDAELDTHLVDLKGIGLPDPN